MIVFWRWVKSWIGGQDSDVGEVLLHALGDRDSRVREYALELLGESPRALPEPQLTHMAHQDNDPNLRTLALGLLVFRGEGDHMESLKHALQDPHEQVREYAAVLLDELGGTSVTDEKGVSQ